MNFIAFLSENHCFLNEVSAKVLESNGARLDYNRTVRLAAVAASDWRDLFFEVICRHGMSAFLT